MKRIVLLVAALVLVVSGVAAVSAYEAHLINVRAHVENALTVDTAHVDFGTVFPQEWLSGNITVQTSESFRDETQDRVTTVNYAVYVEWKPSPGMDYAYLDNGVWVPDIGFYNWMGYFTYIGVDALNLTPQSIGGDLVLVGDPPTGAPGTSAKWVMDAPVSLHKISPDVNSEDKVTIFIDVPVFEGAYNPLTDPEPKPSGLDDPSWIIPDGSMAYTGLPAHPFYDPDGMDFGFDLKIQVINIDTVIVGANNPPDAVDDDYTTAKNTPLNVAAPGVLANDSDVDGDALTVSAVNGVSANVGVQITLPSGALLTLNADGSFGYDPNGQFDSLGVGEEGADSFNYTNDDGNSGSDTANVAITITNVNTPPIADNKTLSATGNVLISVPDGPDDLLAGLIDPDGGTHTVSAIDPTSVNGGDVTLLDASTGNFTYNPPPGFEGADVFNFTIADSGGGSGNGTVTVTVSDMVVFIDASAGGPGDGRLTSPFHTLEAFEAVNGSGGAADPEAGDSIFMYSGSYTGGVMLEASQILVGQGATASLSSITGIVFPPYSDPVPATGGAQPVIANAGGDGITLASTNTIRGLDIGGTADSGHGITGTTVGLASLSEVAISGAGGLLDINGGTLAITLGSLESTSSASPGLRLNNVGGAFAAGATTISGAATGVDIQSSAGATFTFDSLSISGSGDGLVVQNGGTVNIGGTTNTIVSTAGTAVDVANTTIGGSGWTFQSISAGTGAPSAGAGIILDNTGVAATAPMTASASG
jgi:hypothetical protein